MSRTILVTLDGSPLSELALERATDLAAGRDAELVVFSVVDVHLRNELEEFSASEHIDVVEGPAATWRSGPSPCGCGG